MDLLAAIEPKAVLFLGKCGGLRRRCDIIIYKNEKPWMIVECKEMNELLNDKVIFDGRNLFEVKQIRERGYHYISIGRN